MREAIIRLFLGVMIATMAITLFSAPITGRAQCDPAVDPNCQPPPQGCFDAQGVPCTQVPPSNNKPKATKVPTRIHTKTPTPTLTETPTDTPTQTATASLTPTPTPTDTATPTSTAVPPTATATPTVTPTPFCILCGKNSPLLMGGGGALLLLGFVGILILIFRGPLGLGPSGVPGGTDPFPGGGENGTVTLPSENGTIMLPYDGMESATVGGIDLGGGTESFTMTVRDGSDISPDGMSNIREAANNPSGAQASVREAANNPSGAQSSVREAANKPDGVNYPPDPGKSGGGTL